MTRRLRRLPRLLTLAILLALLGAAGAIAQAGASAHSSPRAHATASYSTGIGDEQLKMFANPLWKQLHTKIARYIAPYDAVVHSYSLDKAKAWILAAEAQHVQVMVAFYHSEYTPTKLPSVATYKRDVQKFVKLFPHVHQYQSWDEANRGNVPHAFSSPSAVAAADYYQALIRVCKGCTVIGLDVLDQANISPTLTYVAEFKHEIHHLQTIMPSIWGLHDYSDVNRYESWRTRELARAFGGQVWLTETGGIVQFGGYFTNNHGSGLTRAAKVVKYMFALAGSVSQVKRLYIYDWSGGVSSTRFDAGLMDHREKPRSGYVVVCRQLHAAKCNVKTSSN
jgi:Glycosyl hydrolase catalytic core